MPDKFTFSAGADLPEIRDSVAPAIGFLTRIESPLLLALGWPELAIADNVKHEWLEEALKKNASLVDGAQTAGDTTIEVTAGTGTRFAVGDVIQVGGSRELMIVTTVNANDVVVTRGAFGTVAVAIASGAELVRLSNPAIENEDAPAGDPVLRVRRANFTQIFRKTAAVTRSMRKAKLHGDIQDELDHQVMLAMQDLLRNVAHAVVNGKAQTTNPEGTTAQARTMDGIIWSIKNGGADAAAKDAGGAVLDEIVVNELLQDMFEKGASPDLLVCSPRQKRALSALMEGRVRSTFEEKKFGLSITQWESDFGLLNVLEPDIFVPKDCLLALDTSRIAIARLGEGAEPFDVENLGKVGLVDDREVVGEFTLEIKNARDGGHGLIENLKFD